MTLRPTTRAQRWALALGQLRSENVDLLATHLGGRSHTLSRRTMAQHWFLPIGPFDQEHARAFLARHFDGLIADHLPGGAAHHRLPDRSLELLRSLPSETTEAALRAAFLEQCAEVVHKAVLAGALSPGEAWDWLLRGARDAQGRFSSFQEFWAAGRLGQRLLGAAPDATIDWYEREAKLQCEHPLGAGRLLPWNEELDAELPWQPAACVTLRYSVIVECARCAARSPLVDIQLHRCTACGYGSPMDPRALANAVDRPTLCFLTGTRRSHSTVVHGSPELALRFDYGDPVCAWCDAPLAMASGALLEGPARPIDCATCGGTHVLVEPQGPLEDAFPMAIRAIIADAPPRVHAPAVAVTCAACGGTTTHEQIERMPACAYCGARGVLPEGAWFQLNPRSRAAWIQVLVEERATDRERYGTGALLSSEGDYESAWTTQSGPRPFPETPPAPRPEGPGRWLLALGALDIEDVGGDLFRWGIFPSAAHLVDDAYRWWRRRFPSLSEEAVQRVLEGEVPAAVRPSPAATMRYLQIICRLGSLFGWVDEERGRRVVEEHASRILERYRSWDDYGLALSRRPMRGEHPRTLKQRIDDINQRLWKDISWATGERLGMQTEAVQVRGTTECPRCSWNQVIGDLGARAVTCLACGYRWSLERPPGVRLEPHLFAFRRDSHAQEWIVSDHADDGRQQWILRRETPGCLRCRQPLPVGDVFEASQVYCQSCGFIHEPLRSDALPRVAPDLAAILKARKTPRETTLTTCHRCGGEVASDGTERLMTCSFCDSITLLSDEVFIRIRGHAVAQSHTLIFDHLLPNVPTPSARNHSVTIHGCPVIVDETRGDV